MHFHESFCLFVPDSCKLPAFSPAKKISSHKRWDKPFPDFHSVQKGWQSRITDFIKVPFLRTKRCGLTRGSQDTNYIQQYVLQYCSIVNATQQHFCQKPLYTRYTTTKEKAFHLIFFVKLATTAHSHNLGMLIEPPDVNLLQYLNNEQHEET